MKTLYMNVRNALPKMCLYAIVTLLLVCLSFNVYADDPNTPVTGAGNWVVTYLLAIALPFLTIELMVCIVLVKMGRKEIMEVVKIIGFSALFAAAPAIMGAIWQIVHGI